MIGADERISRTVAAAELGKSTSALDRWRRAGVGPQCVKEGKTVIYTRSAIEAWKAAQVRTSTGAAHAEN
jgi:predicted DNA-binding transcriptional regulator AlpA